MCIGIANGGKTPKELTDKEIVKEKIKAMYPHIVVGGDIDKPCYSIHWYDIEQKKMICGFASYKLEFVRKWLEEEFEVVERDIDDLLNRQQAEIERLNYIIARDNQRQTEKEQKDGNCILTLYDLYDKAVDENKKLNAEIERLTLIIDEIEYGYHHLTQEASIIQTEAIKEFEVKIHEKLHQAEMHGNFEPVVTREMFDSVVKEMVGEQK
jgi:hypothetical protein